MKDLQRVNTPEMLPEMLLTCVCLTAHTDVSVTGDWGRLVVAGLVLVGHLGILLS